MNKIIRLSFLILLLGVGIFVGVKFTTRKIEKVSFLSSNNSIRIDNKESFLENINYKSMDDFKNEMIDDEFNSFTVIEKCTLSESYYGSNEMYETKLRRVLKMKQTKNVALYHSKGLLKINGVRMENIENSNIRTSKEFSSFFDFDVEVYVSKEKVLMKWNKYEISGMKFNSSEDQINEVLKIIRANYGKWIEYKSYTEEMILEKVYQHNNQKDQMKEYYFLASINEINNAVLSAYNMVQKMNDDVFKEIKNLLMDEASVREKESLSVNFDDPYQPTIWYYDPSNNVSFHQYYSSIGTTKIDEINNKKTSEDIFRNYIMKIMEEEYEFE